MNYFSQDLHLTSLLYMIFSSNVFSIIDFFKKSVFSQKKIFLIKLSDIIISRDHIKGVVISGDKAIILYKVDPSENDAKHLLI